MKIIMKEGIAPEIIEAFKQEIKNGKDMLKVCAYIRSEEKRIGSCKNRNCSQENRIKFDIDYSDAASFVMSILEDYYKDKPTLNN